jgi:hypothetical protein
LRTVIHSHIGLLKMPSQIHVLHTGKATGWTIGVLRFDFRPGLGIFLFTTVSRPALGPIRPPIQWVPRAPSLGVKRPGREADHSPTSSAEVKNSWSYTSTPPIHLHGMVLIKKQKKYVGLLNYAFSNTRVTHRRSYGLDDRGSRVRFPAWAGNFSLHHRVQTGSGAHPASYPMGTRGSFPVGKAAGPWSWPLTSI